MRVPFVLFLDFRLLFLLPTPSNISRITPKSFEDQTHIKTEEKYKTKRQQAHTHKHTQWVTRRAENLLSRWSSLGLNESINFKRKGNFETYMKHQHHTLAHTECLLLFHMVVNSGSFCYWWCRQINNGTWRVSWV